MLDAVPTRSQVVSSKRNTHGKNHARKPRPEPLDGHGKFFALVDCVDKHMPSSEICVLMALVQRQNPVTGRCDPSKKRLMQDTDLSEASVREAIKALVKRGKISKRHRRGRTNSYTILPADKAAVIAHFSRPLEDEFDDYGPEEVTEENELDCLPEAQDSAHGCARSCGSQVQKSAPEKKKKRKKKIGDEFESLSDLTPSVPPTAETHTELRNPANLEAKVLERFREAQLDGYSELAKMTSSVTLDTYDAYASGEVDEDEGVEIIWRAYVEEVSGRTG